MCISIFIKYNQVDVWGFLIEYFAHHSLSPQEVYISLSYPNLLSIMI